MSEAIETLRGARAATPPEATAVRRQRATVAALQPWQACATVFTASACTLVIELLAGRLMAPAMGVSLYTWTSIIGVVLAGMTLGNFVGGWLADRHASRVLLSRIFIAAAVACVLLVLVGSQILGVVATWSLPAMARILLGTTFVFFLPSFLMGTTTPQVVKLTLQSLDNVGQTIGSIYAMSAFGSIVGTFLAGFYLADYVGTFRAIWMVAGVLFVCGVLIRGQLRGGVVVVVLAVAGLFGVTSQSAALQGPCDEETGYFCVRSVAVTLPDGSAATQLVLDRMVHTTLKTGDPSYLGYQYTAVYSALTLPRFAGAGGADERVMVVGAGGYAFPRYLEATHPEIPVEVVEIDPGVVEFNHSRLGLSRDTAIVSYAEDARTFFNERAPRAAYSVVQLDAFNGFGVPYHLTTVEFARSMQRAMAADGLLMTNLIDSPFSGLFLQAYVNTLREVFPHVVIYAMTDATIHDRSTYVVVAGATPLTVEVEGWVKRTPEDLTTLFPDSTDIVLTDDFAPTDRLLRPVFDSTFSDR